MAQSGGNLDEARERLERAEQEDDATRLRILEQLYADLEGDLERDAPSADAKSGS